MTDRVFQELMRFLDRGPDDPVVQQVLDALTDAELRELRRQLLEHPLTWESSLRN